MIGKERMFLVCKECLHRKVNLSKGIHCGLTSETPSFSGECPSFKVFNYAQKPSVKRKKSVGILAGLKLFM